MRIKRIILLAFILLSSVVIGSSTSRGAANTTELPPTWIWGSECVDCPRFFDQFTSTGMRLDSKNYLHVVYGGYNLYHAWQTDAGWKVDTVEIAPGVVYSPSFVLDDQDHAHVSYIQEQFDTDGNLKRNLIYAYQDNSGWHAEELVLAEDYPVIALDSLERPVISVSDGMNLYIARNTGEKWQYTLVDTSDEVGGYIGDPGNSILLDENDRIHLAYSRNSINQMGYDYQDLMYAYQTKSGWNYKKIDTGDRCASGASLGRKKNGDFAVSYVCDDQLNYAYGSGSTWQKEIVYTNELISQSSSLAFDGNGSPKIGFSLDDGLVFASKSGSSWKVEGAGLDEGPVSLVLKSNNAPVLASIPIFSYNEIFMVEKIESNWQSSLIDESPLYYYIEDIALDQADQAHIATVSNYDDPITNWRIYTIDYFHPDGTGWQREAITHGIKAILALGPQETPNILYTDYNDDLYYATLGPSGWFTETLGTDVDFPVSLVADDNGMLHTVYAFNDVNGISYAKRIAGVWEKSNLESDNLLYDASVAIDSNGLAAFSVAYRVYEYGNTLRYYHQHDGQWVYEDLADMAFSRNSWLAFDSLGFPHIVYAYWQFKGDGDLFHIYQDENGWHKEFVATEPWLEGMVIDEQDSIHILGRCTGTTTTNTCLISKDSTGWHEQWIPINIRDMTKLLTDSLNRLHFSASISPGSIYHFYQKPLDQHLFLPILSHE